MNALIAQQSSRHGFGAGVRIGLGAPTVDVLWLLVLLFGLGPFIDQPGLLPWLAAAGSAVLAFFAISALVAGEPRPSERPPTFWAGFTAALVNPYQAAWWFSGGWVFLEKQGIAGFSGLIAGIFGWVVLFAWLIAHGAKRWAWFDPAIRFVSIALLGTFSLILLRIAFG